MQADSEHWAIDEDNCDQVWQQMCELNVVNCAKPLDVKVIKNPSAYRLPMVGYAYASEEFVSQMDISYPNIITFNQPSFSKQKVYTEVKALVNGLISE